MNPNRRWALGLGSDLLVLAAVTAAVGGLATGCSVLPATPAVTLYTPQPALPEAAANPQTASPQTPSPQTPAMAPAPKVAWRLAVSRPHSSGPLQSTRILVMARPGEFEVYKQSQWVDPPPAMLATLILQSMERSNRILGLDRSSSGLDADYELAGELRDFEVDMRNGSAYAVIRLQARLVARAENRIIAARLFEAEAPAASPKANDAVKAFDPALGTLLAAVTDWTFEQGQRHWAERH